MAKQTQRNTTKKQTARTPKAEPSLHELWERMAKLLAQIMTHPDANPHILAWWEKLLVAIEEKTNS